jgi:hypothetical protein
MPDFIFTFESKNLIFFRFSINYFVGTFIES